MRYGTMSNVRRSWSPIGKRTVVANQQEYANRYLYSAIDPIQGDSFNLIGFDDAATLQTDIFLKELQKQYPNEHLLAVWDNAPFHKPKILQKKNMTLIYLPSYSPQLNPVERFFGELRKVTANKIFYRGIDAVEKLIENALIEWQSNKEKIKQLCGYDWIIDQWNLITNEMCTVKY